MCCLPLVTELEMAGSVPLCGKHMQCSGLLSLAAATADIARRHFIHCFGIVENELQFCEFSLLKILRSGEYLRVYEVMKKAN